MFFLLAVFEIKFPFILFHLYSKIKKKKGKNPVSKSSGPVFGLAVT